MVAKRRVAATELEGDRGVEETEKRERKKSRKHPPAEEKKSRKKSPKRQQAEERPLSPERPQAAKKIRAKKSKMEAASDVKRTLPRYLRQNSLKPLTWGETQRRLKETGHTLWPKTRRKPLQDKRANARVYFKDPDVSGLLVFKPKGTSDVASIPLISSGHLIPQQKASCFPAIALEPPPGGVVVDACAAPGSKASHLAALMLNQGQIFAFERVASRAEQLGELMVSRGASIVTVHAMDFLKSKSSEEPLSQATHFLVDPSCSSSGMSSQPHSSETDLVDLAERQRQILSHALSFPNAQRVVYSTCSVFEQENEHVVAATLKKHKAFRLARALPWWHRRGVQGTFKKADRCVRTTPEDGTIGFFLAVFEKRK